MGAITRANSTAARLIAPVARLRRRLRPNPVAFVLSGGGPLGAVQVGMLRALAEGGIVPDLILGCSVGAINGAAFAAEPDLDGVARLDRIWRRIAEGDPELMPSRRLPALAQMARKGESLHDPDTLAELLDDELSTKTFSGLRIPFQCVATDVELAEEHWFDSGRLVPALLASAALPVVYPPVEHGPRTLIDGGVLNEIHADRAVELGATELYILHVGHLDGRSLDVGRPFDAAMRAYWVARRFRLEEDLRRLPERCMVHRLPAGSNPRLRFDDFSKAGELADRAHEATAEYLRTGVAPAPTLGPVSSPAFALERPRLLTAERGFGVGRSADTDQDGTDDGTDADGDVEADDEATATADDGDAGGDAEPGLDDTEPGTERLVGDPDFGP